jgi:hypothetical protein
MKMLDEIANSMRLATKIYDQAFDNLFSANHRFQMIQRHGGTQASWITIEQLKNYTNVSIN